MQYQIQLCFAFISLHADGKTVCSAHLCFFIIYMYIDIYCDSELEMCNCPGLIAQVSYSLGFHKNRFYLPQKTILWTVIKSNHSKETFNNRKNLFHNKSLFCGMESFYEC